MYRMVLLIVVLLVVSVLFSGLVSVNGNIIPIRIRTMPEYEELWFNITRTGDHVRVLFRGYYYIYVNNESIGENFTLCFPLPPNTDTSSIRIIINNHTVENWHYNNTPYKAYIYTLKVICWNMSKTQLINNRLSINISLSYYSEYNSTVFILYPIYFENVPFMSTYRLKIGIIANGFNNTLLTLGYVNNLAWYKGVLLSEPINKDPYSKILELYLDSTVASELVYSSLYIMIRKNYTGPPGLYESIITANTVEEDIDNNEHYKVLLVYGDFRFYNNSFISELYYTVENNSIEVYISITQTMSENILDPRNESLILLTIPLSNETNKLVIFINNEKRAELTLPAEFEEINISNIPESVENTTITTTTTSTITRETTTTMRQAMETTSTPTSTRETTTTYSTAPEESTGYFDALAITILLIIIFFGIYLFYRYALK